MRVLQVVYQTFSSDVPEGVEKTNTVLGFSALIGLAFSGDFVIKKIR